MAETLRLEAAEMTIRGHTGAIEGMVPPTGAIGECSERMPWIRARLWGSKEKMNHQSRVRFFALVVAILMGLSGGPMPAASQDAPIEGEGGDDLEASAGGLTTSARLIDLCDHIDATPEGLGGRHRYEPWVKRLLCLYAESDFGTQEEPDRDARRAFVTRALGALRANNTGEGWSLEASEGIAHIVVHKPRWTIPVRDEDTLELEGFKHQDKKSPSARRSWNDVSTTAIGIPDDGFSMPAERTARFESAERLVIILSGLAKWSDMIASNPRGVFKDELQNVINRHANAFRDDLLYQLRQTPKFQPSGDFGVETVEYAQTMHDLRQEIDTANGPVRPPRDPDFSLHSGDINWHDGEEGKTVPITNKNIRVPRVRGVRIRNANALGFTVPRLGDRRYAQYPIKYIRVGESIEENGFHDDYLDHAWSVYTVRATLSLDIFTGVRNGGRSGLYRVVSADGTKDCTARIMEHELRHAQDSWEAWIETVVKGFMARTREIHKPGGRLPSIEDIKLIAEREQFRKGDQITSAFRVIAAYKFNVKKNDEKRSHERIERNFNELYDISFEDKGENNLLDQFERENSRKAEEFHVVWSGLDENCNPVAGDAKAVVGFAEGRVGEDKEVPDSNRRLTAGELEGR